MHLSPVQEQVCCQKCGLILWAWCVANFTWELGVFLYDFCVISYMLHFCILVAESILYFSTVFSDTLSTYSIYKPRDRLGTSKGPQSEECCWKFGKISRREAGPRATRGELAPFVTKIQHWRLLKNKIEASTRFTSHVTSFFSKTNLWWGLEGIVNAKLFSKAKRSFFIMFVYLYARRC